MRQHITPKFYLRGFVDDTYVTPNHVWVFESHDRRWKARGLKTAATMKDYYSFADTSGSANLEFEQAQGEDLERLVAPVLHDRLLQKASLTGNERALIALFVANMIVRTPAYHDGIAPLQALMLQQTLGLMREQDVTDEASITRIMETLYLQYETEYKRAQRSGERPNLTQFYGGEMPPYVVNPPATIGLSLLQMESMAEDVGRMSWTFLEDEQGRFVASDAPCFFIDITSRPDGITGGLLNAATELTLPLSSRVCLVARWTKDPGPAWQLAEEEAVCQVNYRTISGATRFIIASRAEPASIRDHLSEWPFGSAAPTFQEMQQ